MDLHCSIFGLTKCVQLVLLEINQSIYFQNNNSLINSEYDITSKLTFLCPATFQKLLVPLTDVHLHLNRRLDEKE